MPKAKAKAKPGSVRRNFTMPAADAELIRELSRLITPAGEEPNESLAVRVAVREAINNRRKPR